MLCFERKSEHDVGLAFLRQVLYYKRMWMFKLIKLITYMEVLNQNRKSNMKILG